MANKVGGLVGSIIFCILVLLSLEVLAEEEIEDLPKTGTLASWRLLGETDIAVELPWGTEDVIGKTPAPVTASIARLDRRNWIMRLFNNSDHHFRLSLEVLQFNDQGENLRSDYFTHNLRAGSSIDRRVPAVRHVVQIQVNLRDWEIHDP